MLSVQEQETCINYMRDEDYCTLYTSDLTQITRLNKLVAKAPDLYEIVKETEFGKTYKFPKRLISLRSSIHTREYTEEQKMEMGERLKAARKKQRI